MKKSDALWIVSAGNSARYFKNAFEANRFKNKMTSTAASYQNNEASLEEISLHLNISEKEIIPFLTKNIDFKCAIINYSDHKLSMNN